jgi:hypothetical protein
MFDFLGSSNSHHHATFAGPTMANCSVQETLNSPMSSDAQAASSSQNRYCRPSEVLSLKKSREATLDDRWVRWYSNVTLAAGERA